MFENSAEEGTWAKEAASNVGSRKLCNKVCAYMFKQILGCLDGVGETCNMQGFGGRIRRKKSIKRTSL